MKWAIVKQRHENETETYWEERVQEEKAQKKIMGIYVKLHLYV